MRIPQEHENEEERFLNSDVGPFEILRARQLLESNIAAFAAKWRRGRISTTCAASSSRSNGRLPPTIAAGQ